MPWHIETEGKKHEVRDAAHLDSFLQAAEAQPVTDIFLEQIQPHPNPGWKKVVQRVLGRSPHDHESLGSLSVSFAPTHALALFTQSDHHEGEIAILPPSDGQAAATSKKSSVEQSAEPAAKSIPREAAFAALREFYRTGKRPGGVTWIKVSGRGR